MFIFMVRFYTKVCDKKRNSRFQIFSYLHNFGEWARYEKYNYILLTMYFIKLLSSFIIKQQNFIEFMQS